jgi:carbon monoxide dehydrogenase subunit G
MTVRVRRTFDFDVPGEEVWEFISDPANRADAISVVEEYDLGPGMYEATWYIRLPIPILDSTVKVVTNDERRDPPTYVKFVGRSRIMRVTGEHTIQETDDGCQLVNEFVVDGRVPGVERFFRRNLDEELDNLEHALRSALEVKA